MTQFTAPVDDKVIEIVPDGDLILNITHETNKQTHCVRLRVSTKILTSTSRYFEILLSGDRFGEALKVKNVLEQLKHVYIDPAKAPIDELPAIDIDHIGRISMVKSVSAIVTDFFSILHHKGSTATLPAANLANLAIVADRFDALASIRAHFHRLKMFQAIEGRTTQKQDAALTEEKIRQRLLAGMLLGYGPWVEKYSLRLITRARGEPEVIDILWWDLPSRMEEEIDFRRTCVLHVIQALQQMCLDKYASRERQCWLGYDSSPQCDSFQFGEMMRFFIRSGTIRLQGTLVESEGDQSGYTGDIWALIEQLRQIPEYQIDSNHTHCGVRKQLIPALTRIAALLATAGVCGHCWQDGIEADLWMLAKRPLNWGVREPWFGEGNDHKRRHEVARSFFTAETVDWR